METTPIGQGTHPPSMEIQRNREKRCRTGCSSKKETRWSELLYIVLPLLKLDFKTLRLLWFSTLVEEHFLDVFAKDASNFESQRQARVVPARLDSVDASTR